jgi:hypothetical protein
MVEDKVPIEKIKPLLKDAKYLCKGCHRTAAKAENLCAPVHYYGEHKSNYV